MIAPRQPPVETWHFPDDGRIPNSVLPVVLYRDVVTGGAPEKFYRDALRQHGWGGIWVNGMYDFHHYHSTAHEFLGVISGWVRVTLGGPEGQLLELCAGDVVVLPAGTGHKREASSDEFLVLGAYPDGQDWDLCTGKKGERPKSLNNIRKLPQPRLDPLFGAVGPLKELWK